MTAFSARQPKAQPIRVFLVDDHPIILDGMSLLLNDEPDIYVCGEATDLQSAADLVEKLSPHVILVDLNLGTEDGLELLEFIGQRWVGIRTIVVSQHPPELHADRARAAGASGYVPKDQSPQQVVQAVRAVYNGNTFFCDSR